MTESPLAKERKYIKNTRDFKRAGAKKIADLYQRFAAEIIHLDEVIALGRHFGMGNLLAVRVRVRTQEAFEAQVRILKARHEIL